MKTQVSLERGRENELLEVILLDPSDAKRCFLMKKQVSLERGRENDLLVVILLDPLLRNVVF